MSLWSMNDGTALSDNITTNGSTTVTSAGTTFISDGVKGGDLIITAGGEVLRVETVDANNSLTLAVAASGSESGVAATFRRPPINGSGITTAAGTTTIVNDTNVLGVDAGESVAGVDNVTDIAIVQGGTGYKTTKPAITIAGPTARVITQANIDETTNVITATGHNMRDGTKLVYTSNGANIVHSGGTLADDAEVFVRDRTANTFKIASTLGGAALDITNDGNDSQTFTGVTATVAAGNVTLSSGKVSSLAISVGGSDYQSTPSVTIAAPAEQTFNAQSAVTTGTDQIALTAHSFQTGDQLTYADKGGTVIAGLTDGGTFFVIRESANAFKLATSASNASSGTAVDITAGSSENHGLTGVTATATASRGLGESGSVNTRELAHTGWVKKTVGTGGRAGRVHYETLVAASSISGDAEDIATPDS